jgi:hypothetical protein
MDPKEMGCGYVDWINFVQDIYQQRAIGNAVISLRIH